MIGHRALGGKELDLLQAAIFVETSMTRTTPRAGCH